LGYRWRWRRWRRIRKPSHGETGFMNVMGRKWMRKHRVKREYAILVTINGKIRKRCLDFVILQGSRKLNIEIDGRPYHDVVADFERDKAMRRAGWEVMRIPAEYVIPNARRYRPNVIRDRVESFVQK
jgi:very-short-patch-repair endonuclease